MFGQNIKVFNMSGLDFIKLVKIYQKLIKNIEKKMFFIKKSFWSKIQIFGPEWWMD
jgi:hypothetical protein